MHTTHSTQKLQIGGDLEFCKAHAKHQNTALGISAVSLGLNPTSGAPLDS